jgi:hypothetical protein
MVEGNVDTDVPFPKVHGFNPNVDHRGFELLNTAGLAKEKVPRA